MSTQDDIKAVERVREALAGAKEHGVSGFTLRTSDVAALLSTLTRKDEEIAAKDAVIAELVEASMFALGVVSVVANREGSSEVHEKASAFAAALTRAKEQSNG